jgi:hypothetical protein
MGPPKIPPEHVYCVEAGKKHYDLFTTTYVGANYCGRCGLANPFRPRFQARLKTPALPGPYDEVVEVEDSPPRPVSPASQLLRDRPKPVSSIGIGRAQILPNEVYALGSMNTRARIPPSEVTTNPQFMTVASAASRAIQNSKGSTRQPTKQRTGYRLVHISLLLVSLETRYFNGLVVEVPETVLPLKDTVIKFSSADLLTWPSFTETLFDHLRPLPPTIDPANKDLWGLSYASTFSGKKIVSVPNTDKYMTPASMLASGHFSNKQAGQLKAGFLSIRVWNKLIHTELSIRLIPYSIRDGCIPYVWKYTGRKLILSHPCSGAFCGRSQVFLSFLSNKHIHNT